MLTLEPSRLLAGRYRLETTLGQGVHAVVYGATDLRLRRRVTVKMLRSEWAADPELRDRLKVEACTVASLSHPNVVAVHDAGEEAGVGYVVMEQLPGTTLADELRAGRMSETRVTEIGRQVLAALAAAHAAGIVHGNLQPGTVVTGADGSVKLADFAGRTGANADPPATRAAPTGPLAYLAPEQLDIQPASPSGDVYGAGALLYECLVGRPPIGRGPTAALVTSVQGGGPVPIRALRPEADPALASVIERALEPHPDRRFASAVTMSGALLSRVVHVTSTHPVPAAARHLPAAAALLPAAAVGAPVRRPGPGETDRAVHGAGGPTRVGPPPPRPRRARPKVMQRIEGHLVLAAAFAGAIIIGGLLVAALVGTHPSTRLSSHGAGSHRTSPAASPRAGKSAAPPTSQPSFGSGSLPLARILHPAVPPQPKASAPPPSLRSRSSGGHSHRAPAPQHRPAAHHRHRPPAHRHHRPPAHHHSPPAHHHRPPAHHHRPPAHHHHRGSQHRRHGRSNLHRRNLYEHRPRQHNVQQHRFFYSRFYFPFPFSFDFLF